MPKKRKNRGRQKGAKKGRSQYISCSNCGARIPRDKAKKVTRYFYPVESTLLKELQKSGAIINRQKITKYYCVSCAVHYRIVKIGGSSQGR